MKNLSLLLAVGLLAGCGGRATMPVNVVNSFDDKLSCTHLQGEFENNQKRLAELRGESSMKGANNLGMLALNPLAGAMFLDLSDTQKVEAKAIHDRSLKLIDLMKQRACDDIPVVEEKEQSA